MAGYASVREKKNELIRKARDGSVFTGNMATTLIAAITTGAQADLSPLPSGMGDLGWTSTDSATYARSTSSSTVQSFGSAEPTREDITSDQITMSVVAQETKLQTLELYTATDLSNLKAAFTTGEVGIAKPSKPNQRYWRVLGLFVDSDDEGREIYMGRYMPRSRITAFGDQQYNDGDTPVSYNMTFTGFEDSAAGYSHKWFFGGPGWLALLASMGFTQATA